KKITTITLVLSLFFSFMATAQSSAISKLAKDPWTTNQLMAPATLASMIKNPKADKPIIFNIGVVENIKGAINLGASSEEGNLERFKKDLSSIPKTSTIVVYCGC